MNIYPTPAIVGAARINWGASTPWADEVPEPAVMSTSKWMAQPYMPRLGVPKPSVSYSKRSEMIAHLRETCALLLRLEADGYQSPSIASQELAESFINELPQAATAHCQMSISDEGEINFVCERGNDCFRAIICDDASLSYYGRVNGREYFGDDVQLSAFPFMKLVQVV